VNRLRVRGERFRGRPLTIVLESFSII